MRVQTIRKAQTNEAMNTKKPTTPGTISVTATPDISVSYDSHYNMVEIIQAGRVIRSEIAPANYTVRQFAETVNRVKMYYSNN